MTNHLTAAVEALEKARSQLDISDQYTKNERSSCNVSSVAEIQNSHVRDQVNHALAHLRAALAEAEGSVTLPVRWVEEGGSLPSTQLFLGDCYVGCFFDNDDGRVFVEYEPDEVIWAKHVADLDTAKAALLAAVRGETT